MGSKELEHFKNKYRANIQTSRCKYTKPKKISVDQIQDWDMTFEIEYGVQIDMSQRDFDHLVHMEKHFYDTMNRSSAYMGDHARYIVEENERESRIRASNPSVRAAYEKYQNLLKLVDSFYD